MTYRISENAAETSRVVAEEHITREQTEAGEDQHGGHHGPPRTRLDDCVRHLVAKRGCEEGAEGKTEENGKQQEF